MFECVFLLRKLLKILWVKAKFLPKIKHKFENLIFNEQNLKSDQNFMIKQVLKLNFQNIIKNL